MLCDQFFYSYMMNPTWTNYTTLCNMLETKELFIMLLSEILLKI